MADPRTAWMDGLSQSLIENELSDLSGLCFCLFE